MVEQMAGSRNKREISSEFWCISCGEKGIPILRELIQALEYEPVKAAIAEFLEEPAEELRGWQRDAMEGKRQAGLFAPEA